jgi:hypothetical protein
MKIVVANEKEKELIMNFIKAMQDLDMFNEMESLDHSEERIYLSTDQYRVISDNLHSVEIDKNEEEMTFDDDTCITGTCKKCGVTTEGTSNGDSITYVEYLRSRSEEQQSTWLCETCYLAETE